MNTRPERSSIWNANYGVNNVLAKFSTTFQLALPDFRKIWQYTKDIAKFCKSYLAAYESS